MNKWLYPNTIAAAKAKLNEFLLGNISIEDLQTSLYQAEQNIAAYEERWLRNLFFSTENKIEEINYTVSDLYKHELICNEIKNCLEEIENFKQSQCILNINTTLKENKP